MKKPTKAEIRADLLAKLEERGLTDPVYRGLVEDYLTLWEMQANLAADIRTRGVAVAWDNGGGQTGIKKNDSVAELVKVNTQMLKILNDLGLRGASMKPVEPDDTL